MKTPRAEREILRLRAKHGKDRSLAREMPDLSVAQNHPSFGSGFAPIVWRPPYAAHRADLVVDHIHKSGLQVLSRSELPYAGGRKV